MGQGQESPLLETHRSLLAVQLLLRQDCSRPQEEEQTSRAVCLSLLLWITFLEDWMVLWFRGRCASHNPSFNGKPGESTLSTPCWKDMVHFLFIRSALGTTCSFVRRKLHVSQLRLISKEQPASPCNSVTQVVTTITFFKVSPEKWQERLCTLHQRFIGA